MIGETLILAGVLAAAVAPPVAARAADSTWHPDADSAAMEAFRRLEDAKGRKSVSEHAGGIVRRDDGQHSYTTHASQTQHDHFAVRLQFAAGEHLAGLYHNHPGTDADAGYFSPDDIALADRLKVPSYIRFDDGTIRKYTPGVTQTQDYTGGSGSRLGRGKVARGDALTPAKTAPATPAEAAPAPEAAP